MKTKTIFSLSLICALSTLLIWAQPTISQSRSYDPELFPNSFSTPKLHWQITNATAEVVEFGFGSETFWQAQADQSLTFEIQKIVDNELHGMFTIGNLTIPANDSRIAAELALSIWPWFPGLVTHLDWNAVDQEANDAANGFYMNGSLNIRSTATTRSYIYHQGPWGNQNTTVVYDVNSGILLAGYTEFFFLNDYHLGIEFVSLTQKPTSLMTLLFIGTLGIAVGILTFGFLIHRRQLRKE